MFRFRPTLTPLDDRLAPAVLPAGFSESLIGVGLNQPTAMAVAPDGRVFVTEQTGAIRIVKNGQTLGTPFAALTVDPTGERGLIGITLDPNFSRNGGVYVYHTVPAANGVPAYNRITRFTANGDVAAAGSERILLNLDGLSATNHNGGALRFGSDGKLYIGVGDNAVPANAQSPNTRLGKLLRINADGSIPADNPATFPGVAGATSGANRAIFAVGLRNPFTFDVQPGTGKLFINDVGESAFEEVDEGIAGANYGWPATQGDFAPASFPQFTRPIYAYPHDGPQPFAGAAITGGAFYNPLSLSFPADAVGDYYFADIQSGWINQIDGATRQVTNFATNLVGKNVVGLGVTPTGDLLYLARGNAANQGGLFAIKYTPNRTLVAVGSGSGSGVVQMFDPTTGVLRERYSPFGVGFTGGIRVATADVTGDRIPDIIAGAGPGGGPRVVVIDGATGQIIRDFFAFESTFTGGVFVAAADIDRDGYADLIVSADVGGGPRIRVFNTKTGNVMADFFAFESTFTGGVRIAAGDSNGDGVPDLAIAAGAGGAPRVAIIDGRDLAAGATQPARLGTDIFAYESTLRNGAYVASGDLDGDGFADLVTGAGPDGAPRVRAFSGRTAEPLADFFAGNTSNRGGVSVTTADSDGDGRPDVITGPGPGAAPRVSAYKVIGGLSKLREIEAFESTFTAGVFVG